MMLKGRRQIDGHRERTRPRDPIAMPKPFDATMRQLLQMEPAAWLELLGLPVPDPGQVQIIDSNLSTVTAESDKLIRVGGPEPYLFHSEFLSGRALDYPEQVHWYNALAGHRHRLPVHSALVLLRPAADGPELTGQYERAVPGRGRNLWFGYEVIRVWELPPERLLAAGLAVLPLAPIARVSDERLPAVLTAVADRLRDEAEPDVRVNLNAATEILLGLNHPRERVEELIAMFLSRLANIPGIEASSVYQDIFAKGRAEGEALGRAEGEALGRAEGEALGRAEGEIQEARRILIHLGQTKFGEPAEVMLTRIAAIDDRDRLDQLCVRLLKVASWEELLGPEG